MRLPQQTIYCGRKVVDFLGNSLLFGVFVNILLYNFALADNSLLQLEKLSFSSLSFDIGNPS